MANSKITSLAELAESPASDDIFPLVDTSVTETKKVTMAHLTENMVVVTGDQTIAGVKTFNSFPVTPSSDPSTDYQVANKQYVDNSAAPSINMSLTGKGVAEEATQVEIDAGTQAGGSGAELAVNPKYLKDSAYYTQLPSSDQKAALAGSGTPSGANKFVTADTDALKELLSNKDITTTLGTSDTKYPSQKATKTYVDNNKQTSQRSSGVITRDISAANGAVNTAHGLGVTPTKVRITGMIIGSDAAVVSIGSYDSSGQRCVFNYYDSSGGGEHKKVSQDTSNIIVLQIDPGTSAGGTVAVISVDSTNITLTWTKTGSPTGVAQILWEAEYHSA